jgi:hypothetical protein
MFVDSSGQRCRFRAYRPEQADATRQGEAHKQSFPDHANAVVVTEER